MKTRTNQPVLEYEVKDITKMSDTLLNQLKCGDRVSKITGEQKHNYVVSYKEEKHGICLTYVDCGYMETISYDYTNGHWVFNSKDVIEVPTEGGTKLYKHIIHDSGQAGYTFILITTEEMAIPFANFTSFDDLYDYLTSILILAFYEETRPNLPIIYDTQDKNFCCSNINDQTLDVVIYDDWTLATTTDVVQPL